MSAPRYDLVVIGAGPAGSAAALCAARAGLRVALVDKARFPRVKLCGGLVTGRALRALRQPLPADLLERRDSLSFFDRGAPLGQITGGPPVYLTTRLGLDAHLLAQALQAGAEDFTGHPVAGLAPGFVQLRDGAALRAPLILGADGVNSAVARHLFGRAFDPATIGFALEIEAPPSEDQSLQVDFGAAAWGYGWRFAKSGSTTIGVGGLQARNPDMKARLAAYLALLPDQAGARVMGHHLPFGELRRVPGHGRMLLAGDAAGLVDPITGEGIAHALQSGHLAAEAVIAALAAGRPDSALPRYARALAPTLRALRHARMLRPLVFSDRCGGLFRQAFRDSATMKLRYMELLAGEVDYAALLRRAAWRLPLRLLRGR
ncbi:MAG TPA: geranylgeranyl reductase [Citreicella sp.]|jgi:menaquinone-9 beta-reductase|nr:geranylgeranyl reductase [Citreicella sp.]